MMLSNYMVFWALLVLNAYNINLFWMHLCHKDVRSEYKTKLI